MTRPGNHFARVFFEDGTVRHALYDAGASLVDAVLFATEAEAREADRAALGRRLAGASRLGKGIDDLRTVTTAHGSALVPMSRTEKVVIEASESYGSHWWTGLALRESGVLATNRDGGEVYVRNAGLFRPHPDNVEPDQFPVTGPAWDEVDFRDLDAENVDPDAGSLAP